MPKATTTLYNDQQAALNSIRTLELNARAQGDRELESAARRARKELARDDALTTPDVRRENP